MVFQVAINNTGEVYSCDEKKHLLAGMIQLGCRSGGCGVCKIKILSGDCTSKKMSRDHVSEDEERQGIMLACRVFPQADISLSVIGHLQKAVMS